VEKEKVPEELWMILSHGGRPCMECGKRFFGKGIHDKVMRTFRGTKWMFEVVCCGMRCFDLISKDD